MNPLKKAKLRADRAKAAAKAAQARYDYVTTHPHTDAEFISAVDARDLAEIKAGDAAIALQAAENALDPTQN